MNEARNIVHSSFALLSGRFGSTLINVGFTIYFAHRLTKIQFATLAVFDILAAITNMISNFGLETYCLREIPALIKNKELSRASAFIKTAITNRLIWSTAIGISLIFFSYNIAGIFFKDVSYANVIRIISIGVVFFSMNTSMGLIASSLKYFREIAIINFMITLVFCVTSFSLFYIMGFEGWVIGFSLSRGVGCILYLLLLKDWLFTHGEFYPWTKMVRKSFPYYIRGFVKFGLLRLDQIVIGIFMTPASLSTYYVAKRFSLYVNMLIESMGRPLLIRMSEVKRHGKENMPKMLTQISRYNSFIFLPVCLGIAAYGFPLLEIYGGEKYTGGFMVLVVLCLARMLKGLMHSVYENGIFIHGEPREALIVEVIGCFSNFVCLVILVPFFGAIGVALSVLFSTASAQFSARYLLNRIIFVRFDTGALRKVLFAIGGFIILSIFMQVLYYRLYLFPIYFLGSFFVFLVIMCNLLDLKDIKLMLSIIPKGEKYCKLVINFLAIKKKSFIP